MGRPLQQQRPRPPRLLPPLLRPLPRCPPTRCLPPCAPRSAPSRPSCASCTATRACTATRTRCWPTPLRRRPQRRATTRRASQSCGDPASPSSSRCAEGGGEEETGRCCTHAAGPPPAAVPLGVAPSAGAAGPCARLWRFRWGRRRPAAGERLPFHGRASSPIANRLFSLSHPCSSARPSRRPLASAPSRT